MFESIKKHLATRVLVETNDVPSWEPWIPPYWGNQEKDLRFWDGKQCRLNRTWAIHYTDPDIEFILIFYPKFLTDGGSLPQLVWNIMAPFGKGILAWFPHDAFYGCHYLPRDISDHVMLNLLSYADLPTRHQYEAYWCVRAFGGISYDDNVERRDPETNELISHVKADSRTIITPDYRRLYSKFYIIRTSPEYKELIPNLTCISQAEADAIWAECVKASKAKK